MKLMGIVSGMAPQRVWVEITATYVLLRSKRPPALELPLLVLELDALLLECLLHLAMARVQLLLGLLELGLLLLHLLLEHHLHLRFHLRELGLV